MRDALSIMDQVIAYSNDVITLDDAIMITGGIKVKVDQVLNFKRLLLEAD